MSHDGVDDGAGGGNRTHTPGDRREILSLVRLPVSPLRPTTKRIRLSAIVPLSRGILTRHTPITAEFQELMTHIGPSVDFDGDLTCDEDVTFEGRLTGNIHVREATLIVGQPAHVEASIRAARVVVHGTVQGSISAGERIELAPTAVVTGDLSATQVVITDGAQFNGRVDMGRRTIAAKVAQYKAATK